MASLCALLLGFAIAVLAMAGPSWRTGEQPLLQGEAPLVVVLDLSGAMLANDLPPSRLLHARATLATLLQQRSGGQDGLERGRAARRERGGETVGVPGVGGSLMTTHID